MSEPQEQPKRKRKIIPLILAVIGGLLFLCIIIAILVPSSDREPGTSGTPQQAAAVVEQPAAPAADAPAAPAPTATTAPTATPTPEPIDLTPAELRTKWDTLTEVQQKAYAQELVGQRIRWTCPVSEVKSGGQVTLSCDSGAALTNMYVRLTIPAEDALKYNKEQQVTFEGKINKVETFLIFALNVTDVTIFE